MAKSKTDAQIMARLNRDAPEVLEAEVDFDALVKRIIRVTSGNIDPAQQRYKRTRFKSKP
jgi:hypothetical protein